MLAYAVNGSQNAGTNQGVVGVIGSATVQPELYYLQIGSSATPASTAINYKVRRSTTTGTSTAVTPEPVDSATAARSTAGSNWTVIATYAGVPYLDISLNQQFVYQWYAHPGREIKCRLAASNGIILDLAGESSGTALVEATMQFQE